MRNAMRPKRLALAIVGIFLAISSVFAKEKLIAETENGKVTIDTESVQRRGFDVEAGFWAYSGVERTALIATVEGCDQGQGRIKYKAGPADPPSTRVRIERWTGAGRQTADKMAAAACEQAGSKSKTR